MAKKQKLSFKTNTPPPRVNIKVNNNGYNHLYPEFSFKNYIQSDDYFTEQDCNDKRNSLYKFLSGIKSISGITWQEIKQNPKVYHFHQVYDDITILSKYKDIDLDQLKIPGLQHGRWIGFFDEKNIFNILLYDCNHQIYPRK